MFKKILVGNDGSEGAEKALRTAIDIAKKFGAEVHSISVEEDLPKYAATVGEVLEAKAEKNGYFAKLNQEAKEMAAKEGSFSKQRWWPDMKWRQSWIMPRITILIWW